MAYRHKTLIEGGPAEGVQLQNRFRVLAEGVHDGSTWIAVLQEGQSVPDATWFREETFKDLFEPIPE